MLDHKETNPTQEQIEQRAYEIYLARGAEDGYALSDWIAAEQELRARALQPLANETNNPKQWMKNSEPSSTHQSPEPKTPQLTYGRAKTFTAGEGSR